MYLLAQAQLKSSSKSQQYLKYNQLHAYAATLEHGILCAACCVCTVLF